MSGNYRLSRHFVGNITGDTFYFWKVEYSKLK